jgi:O-antigen ligase
LSGEGRFAIYAATLRAAIEFLPFGSGLSTFASVFPRFQTGVFGGYIDYAHNDYLQFFMEAGLVAPVIVALLLATYVMRMGELLRRDRARSFTVLQIAAGVGMLPMILHSLFDFALHMPANAMWFATLAGVMLHPGVGDDPGRR